MVNVTASHFPKHFLLNTLSNLLDLCLADSRILYFWQVLESIYEFIIELYTLQFLFVRGSNKQQRSGRIISNFTKGQTFSFLWQPSTYVDNLTMDLPSCTIQKKLSSPFQFGLEEKILGHSIERRAYRFVLKIARMLPIPTGRIGIGWQTLYNSYHYPHM